MKRVSLKLSFLLIFSFASHMHAEEATYTEYEVKAAFLYNFTRFVEWPESVSEKNSFTIGVLGDDPFTETLEQTIKNKSVQGRKIFIHKYQDLNNLGSCDILYVGSFSRFPVDKILSHISSPGILTVGDSNDFMQKGGMIHLYLLDNKLRFEINLKAAAHSGLKISSKLLSLATRVES
jgi:hypothetical protein